MGLVVVFQKLVVGVSRRAAMAYPQAGVDVRDLPHPPPGAFAEQSTHSPSPYAPPHVQGQLTLLPGLYLQSPFESHEINLLAQRILRISITIFVWSTLNTVRAPTSSKGTLGRP
jgi:hypothetical protein